MRTMSRTPWASSFFGIGRLPHSGMPGAPTGPALRSTSTLSASTSRWGSSMRADSSAWSSNTSARPLCLSSAGEAAEGLITAPSGARLPVNTARVLPSPMGLSMSRMMSSSRQRASVMFCPMVLPLTVRQSSVSRLDTFCIRAGRPPAKKKSSIKNLPDGYRLASTGVALDTASMSAKVSLMPARPAIAGRCTAALVEPPSAM